MRSPRLTRCSAEAICGGRDACGAVGRSAAGLDTRPLTASHQSWTAAPWLKTRSYWSSIAEVFRFSVDPQVIYCERVEGGHAIYLDTNAWSDLAERRSDAAIRVYDAVRVAHQASSTVFPLSYASITELIKREVNDDSVRQAELMDVLSRGVACEATPMSVTLRCFAHFSS